MCQDIYGPELPVREVQLSHPAQACAYEHYFGCPVRYDGDSSGLTFALDTVRKVLPAVNQDLAKANDRILKDLDYFLTGTKITHQVRRAIMRELTSGKPSAKDVARELALAPRTLQRKLQEEGTTYKEVFDEVRKKLAQRYLQNGKQAHRSDIPHRVCQPVGVLPSVQGVDRAKPLRRARSRLTTAPIPSIQHLARFFS